MFKLFSMRGRKKPSQAVQMLERYGVTPEIQQRFGTLLQTAEERELFRANPHWLAFRLQLPLGDTLRLLLMALKEGFMILNWEVQCPCCGGLDPRWRSLSDFRRLHTCPACHAVNPTTGDDFVRVTFTVDERLRRLGKPADDPAFRDRLNQRYGIVSGHQLLTLQTFRDLFPKETIPPQESLAIRQAVILFTDLTGSTALYARRGDATAYTWVSQHFEALFAVVDRHQGAVVKTIGDAVMAAFTLPEDAVKAAIAMHQAMDELNQRLQLPPEDALILKIGISMGACVTVTLNDRLDYFGTTVNRAARVQAKSQGRDLLLTENLRSDAGVAKLLQNYSITSMDVSLKGLESSTRIDRVQF